MKTFICLAISCLLVGLLYVYVRQQFAQQSAQITTLAEMMRSVAQEVADSRDCRDLTSRCPAKPTITVQHFEPVVVEEDGNTSESDEGETDDDEVSESEVDDRQPVSDDEVEDDRKQIQTDQIMEFVINVPAPTISEKSSMEEITEVILNHEEPSLAKVVVLESSNFEEWSMKQLKEKVNQMGGPGSLRSKKAMVEFLEKNIR